MDITKIQVMSNGQIDRYYAGFPKRPFCVY
jgi:hypothetical protein